MITAFIVGVFIAGIALIVISVCLAVREAKERQAIARSRTELELLYKRPAREPHRASQ